MLDGLRRADTRAYFEVSHFFSTSQLRLVRDSLFATFRLPIAIVHHPLPSTRKPRVLSQKTLPELLLQ
jgi:hypothetical protein